MMAAKDFGLIQRIRMRVPERDSEILPETLALGVIRENVVHAPMVSQPISRNFTERSGPHLSSLSWWVLVSEVAPSCLPRGVFASVACGRKEHRGSLVSVV